MLGLNSWNVSTFLQQVLCPHFAAGQLHLQLLSLPAQMINLSYMKNHRKKNKLEAQLKEFSKLSSKLNLPKFLYRTPVVFLPSDYLGERDNLAGVQTHGYECHLYPRDK